MLLPHFDDHPPLPAEKILLSKRKEKIETDSYHICLDRMKKSFEHRRILIVPGLGVSLPFRQAFLRF